MAVPTMRDLLQLVESAMPEHVPQDALSEEVNPQGGYFLHVSPGKNLRAILRNGLQQVDLGNYTGYASSLAGVYVTRIPEIIRQHVFARESDNHFVLVVVRVATPAVIDEDVLDDHLQQALQQVARQRGATVDDLAEEEAEDEENEYPCANIGREMVPFLRATLGPSHPQAGADIDALLAEFCAGWFCDRVIGTGDIDGDWWIATKDRILQAFPALAHPQHGADYSLRLSAPVGYQGETRIVAVIEVTNGIAKVVKGAIPPEAKPLVDEVVQS